MTNENDASNEFSRQDNFESNQDADQRVVAWLSNRVPVAVPSEVATVVRSAMAAELEGDRSAANQNVHGVEAARKVSTQRRLSLGVVTAALIVLTIGLNVFVAWRGDQRVAAVVGEQSERSIDSNIYSNERAARKISVATLFEFNLSLIQRELNHERIESSGIGFDEQRQPARSTEEGHSKEIPDRSGAALRPRSGIQRVPKLAGFVTA